MFVFIINPSSRSGRGLKIWGEIEPILKRHSVDYQGIISQSSEHMMSVIRQLSDPAAEQVSQIVVLGGDGTLNQVVNAIQDYTKVEIGYIPTGSSNDFARDMEFPSGHEKLLETILQGKVCRKLDIGTVQYDHILESADGSEIGQLPKTGRFDVSAGIGFDAGVCYDAMNAGSKNFLNRIGLGKLTYVTIALQQLAGSTRKACDLVLDDTKKIHLDHFLFVAFMIHRYEGGGFKFCPQADAEDGLLDLCVVGDVPNSEFLRALPSAFKGNHYRYPGIEHYTAKKVTIRTEDGLWVHTDGEVLARADALTVTIEQQVLRFLQ
ncbi:MAG: diacylglycerol kinase family lipid kinase [Lachnospiraceae bacterium]|nr:diacylglycerol kinase family lipid kinase [Lachnospiraceae bacterium]